MLETELDVHLRLKHKEKSVSEREEKRIELGKLLYIYVCMYVCRYVFDCLWENNTKKLYAKMRGRNYVVQTRVCSKSSFGISKQSVD